MKVRELIKELKALEHQYGEVQVQLYSCGGCDDFYPVEEVEQNVYQFSSGESLITTNLTISVGCNIHGKKWNCEPYPKTFKRKLANLLVKLAEWIIK